MIRLRCWTISLVFCFAACASETPKTPVMDASGVRDSLVGDNFVRPDTVLTDAQPVLDTALVKPDAECALGTVEHCKQCGDRCPGRDNVTTARVCRDSGCDIECKGEYYDINGLPIDGCEAEDDLPLHNSQAQAKDLGDVKDCAAVITVNGLLPSDNRHHRVAPASRPNGRADWYKIHINDGLCVVDAKATVSLTGLPASTRITLTAHYICDNGTTIPAVRQDVHGGDTTLLEPGTKCTTSFNGDDSGTLVVEIKKASGPHSDRRYSLTIEP